MKQNVVDSETWLAARRELLSREKEFTRLRDALSESRRRMPWQLIDQDYVFQGPDGDLALADMFEGRSQLIVYHFMFHPDWNDACKSCSFWADSYNSFYKHLNQRDVSLAAVSRAPLEKLQGFASRMGWHFPWYSSLGSEFNYDFRVSFTEEQIVSGSVDYNFRDSKFGSSEAPGLSVFFRDEGGQIYRTYSCYARGLDMLNGAYHHLDLVPRGRDEADLPHSMAWLNHQDSYD